MNEATSTAQRAASRDITVTIEYANGRTETHRSRASCAAIALYLAAQHASVNAETRDTVRSVRIADVPDEVE